MNDGIGILNYGIGNIGSLLNMFRKLDLNAHLVSTPKELAEESRLILAGVGAFDHAMSELASGGLIGALSDYVSSGKRLLGICLGMQLLVECSEEGVLPGLGYIRGKCRRLAPASESSLRVPHMGWNTVCPGQPTQLFEGLEEANRFYFVHSYFVEPCEASNILGWTEYDGQFASVIAQDNVIGVQFHPEKSHIFGMMFLKNWSRL